MIDSKRKSEILQAANANLKAMFKHMPGKYKAIKLSEIKVVYDRNVLGINADAKTKKGLKFEYLTGIVYLAPSKLSGIDMCPMASDGCASACLFTAGRGALYSITRARIVKTLAYHFDKPRFINTVKKSIQSLIIEAKNKGLTPIVRLNGTSDILWEHNTDIIQSFPDCQFYDYTKINQRFKLGIPSNYHLTFSVSETNEIRARQVLAHGGNVAMVFRKEIPTTLWGYTVVNGDETDLRFNDPKNVIVALKAKGKAKKDTTGFVRELDGTMKIAA
jgi:hypothetical protein